MSQPTTSADRIRYAALVVLDELIEDGLVSGWSVEPELKRLLAAFIELAEQMPSESRSELSKSDADYAPKVRRLIASVVDKLANDPRTKRKPARSRIFNRVIAALADPEAARKPPTPSKKPDWMPPGSFGKQRPPDDPAVPILESVSWEHIQNLENRGRVWKKGIGSPLRRLYGMTFEMYARKWGLDRIKVLVDWEGEAVRKVAPMSPADFRHLEICGDDDHVVVPQRSIKAGFTRLPNGWITYPSISPSEIKKRSLF